MHLFLIQLFWQARVVVVPQFWQPIGSVLMINDINSTTHEEAQPCSMALCNDNDHLLSASGGQVSFYTMMTDKVNLTILHDIWFYKKVGINVNFYNIFCQKSTNEECCVS